MRDVKFDRNSMLYQVSISLGPTEVFTPEKGLGAHQTKRHTDVGRNRAVAVKPDFGPWGKASVSPSM